MWLVVAIAVAVFVWFKWRGRTRERAMTDVVAQAAIERIAIEL
jgi:uncharacterized membrane protein YccC